MDEGFVEVHLIRYPLPLWQRTQEHFDELLREFALIAGGSSDSSVPRRLLDLVDDLTGTYAGLTTGTEQERNEAIRRGDTETDLVYRVPVPVADAVRHLGDMLDKADEYCRQGEHLLTLQTPHDQLLFRRWFLSEFLAQTAGEPPTSWPDYTAGHDGP